MALIQQKSDNDGKLSDIQLSILRLFEQGMSESETLEIRKMLMDYFDHALQKELEQVLSRKSYSEADFHKMLTDDHFTSK